MRGRSVEEELVGLVGSFLRGPVLSGAEFISQAEATRPAGDGKIGELADTAGRGRAIERAQAVRVKVRVAEGPCGGPSPRWRPRVR